MPYELSYFHDLIDNEILTPEARTKNWTKMEYKHKTDSIRLHTKEAKGRMVHYMIGCKEDRESGKYIKDHQDALVTLADSLLEILDQADIDNIYTIGKDPSLKNICKILYRSFEEMLYYFEKHCRLYFDQRAIIPYVRRVMVYRELRSRLEEALAAIRNLDVPEELLEIVKEPYDNFITSDEPHNLSFYRLSYLRQLLKILLAIPNPKPGDPPRPDVRLIHKLFYMNFNSGGFSKYYKRRCKAEMEELATRDEKLEKLSWYHKVLEQVVPRPEYNLYHVQTPIVAIISTWLEEEEAHLNKVKIDKQGKPVPLGLSKTTQQKLKTKLSVPKLANMFRLLFEAGHLDVDAREELFRFVCESFASLKNTKISPTSFSNHFYSTDPNLWSSVRTLLHDLIKRSHKLEQSTGKTIN